MKDDLDDLGGGAHGRPKSGESGDVAGPGSGGSDVVTGPEPNRLRDKKALGYGRLGKGLKAAGSTGERVWWDRGYYPHVESPRLIQHVTFHLADSLPRHVVEKMAAELKSVPPSLRDTEKEKRIAAYLDAGRGSCVLRIPELADLVQRALMHFQGERYQLFAWCIMPNHVHVLFQVNEGWTMSKVVATWKSYTGRRISSFLQHSNLGYAGHQPGRSSAGLVPGVPKVWHRDYFDRYIRDNGHFNAVVDYIHKNPVKAGLVKKAEDWRWSSGFGGKA